MYFVLIIPSYEDKGYNRLKCIDNYLNIDISGPFPVLLHVNRLYQKRNTLRVGVFLFGWMGIERSECNAPPEHFLMQA